MFINSTYKHLLRSDCGPHTSPIAIIRLPEDLLQTLNK